MSITAILVEGEGSQRPTLRRVGDGYEGSAYFLVNTRDPGSAILATDAPDIGDVWPWAARLSGGELDGVVCYQIDVEECFGVPGALYDGGLPAGWADHEGGWSFLKASYRTPGLGNAPPSTSLSAYTVIQTYENGYTQSYAADASPGDPPLNGGDGISTAEGAIVAIVTRRYPTGTIPWATLTGLMSPRTVNDNAFNLPPDPINGQQIAVGIGEALYLMAERGEEDGVLVVRHHIALKPDWLYEEFDQAADGTRSASRISNQYPEATFNTLTLFGY